MIQDYFLFLYLIFFILPALARAHFVRSSSCSPWNLVIESRHKKGLRPSVQKDHRSFSHPPDGTTPLSAYSFTVEARPKAATLPLAKA